MPGDAKHSDPDSRIPAPERQMAPYRVPSSIEGFSDVLGSSHELTASRSVLGWSTTISGQDPGTCMMH